MNARSAYQIMQDMKAAEQAEAEKFKAENLHSETLRRVFEAQGERVPCVNCLAITKTDVHVDYRGGMAVYTLYRCPRCKHEFMEKDIPR
jgi:hypothetical protein